MQRLGLNRFPHLGGQVSQLAVGLGLYGVSIGFLVKAGLGLDAWDVFHQGVSVRSGLSLGTVVIVVSGGVLLLWIPIRQRPGFGTLANTLVVGLVADLVLQVLPEAEGIVFRGTVLAAGIVLNGVATGPYIGAGLGPGPRDGLMTGLANRTRWSIRSIRTLIELAVLAAGWSLGGSVGVGTLAYAITIGPLSQYFIGRFSTHSVSPRHAMEPTGVVP